MKKSDKQYFFSTRMSLSAPNIDIHLLRLYPINIRPTSPSTLSFFLTRACVSLTSPVSYSTNSLCFESDDAWMLYPTLTILRCNTTARASGSVRDICSSPLFPLLSGSIPSTGIQICGILHENLFEWFFRKSAMVLYLGLRPESNHIASKLVCASLSSFLVVRMP